jgi:hypothetical protein
MRSIAVFAVAAIRCRSPLPPTATPAPVACTIPTDHDLLEYLRTTDCSVTSPPEIASPDLEVRLERGGPPFYDTVTFRVVMANRGSAAVPIDLRIRDQRLCFDGGGGGVPTHACALLPWAPADVESRARVFLPPGASTRVEELVFVRHTLVERPAMHGARGWFEEKLPPGKHELVVTLPLAFASNPIRLSVVRAAVDVP